MDNDEKENEILKYTPDYGLIDIDSKEWDDVRDIKITELLKRKITNIKIFSSKYNDKVIINGISITFKNSTTGNIKTIEHRGNDDIIDTKELNIKNNEYLSDFHIRFPDSTEYISQIGFSTNKKNTIMVGSEDGDSKTVCFNGGDNIIIGTRGWFNKHLDSIGCIFISKKDYLQKYLFDIFMLRYQIKNNENFKKEWDKKYKELSIVDQFLWKTAGLEDDEIFIQILKYCYCYCV